MYEKTIEQWGMFEWSGKGKSSGNPFADVTIRGRFQGPGEDVTTEGFYDGDGVYKIRFMPRNQGHYTFQIGGDFSDESFAGEFDVTAPGEGNHGPVSVCNTYCLQYADGTPYYSIGTTCYVWELQSDALIEKTLQNLEKAGFNKIRFCIFPKHYDYNLREPRSYPYEGSPMDSSVLTRENFQEYTGKTEGNHWDFYRFNPAHFRHIEDCIRKLSAIGVEADIIVFHPYDRWGFSSMSRAEDTFYMKYLINRLSAFRNVWWAMANEYDLFEEKNAADWDYIGNYFMEHDPYQHLRSIHNCHEFFDHSKPWITHVSAQRIDIYRTVENTDEIRKTYQKPVIWDEISYEGNIQFGWGNITGEEMVRRFWEASMRGAYPGHGETYYNEEDILWWSHGGDLHGESHKRFAFLHRILCETPGNGLKIDTSRRDGWDCALAMPADEDLAEKTGYRIYYFSFMRPSLRDFTWADDTSYRVEVIDTWNMTITDAGVHRGTFRIQLPGRPYIAVRIRKA